jgi:hypothetical protein
MRQSQSPAKTGWSWSVWPLLLTVAVTLAGPLAQNPDYHRFADHRTQLGIANAWNSLSNLPILLAGGWGLVLLRKHWHNGETFIDPRERYPFLLVFLGAVLTGLGSFWYHLSPDDARLVWDRLPLALAFAAFISLAVADRAGADSVVFILTCLTGLGIGSVLLWREGALVGQGDLRPYVLLQIAALTAVPWCAWLFPPRYTGARHLWLTVFGYATAKICEWADVTVFAATAGGVSGHTLKHLAGAWAIWRLGVYLQQRQALK